MGKKLILSIVSVILCLCAVAGGTYGWHLQDNKEHGFNEETVTICVEESRNLALKAENIQLEWLAKDEQVAAVENGTVTGNMAGEAVVVAKQGLHYYECNVVVVDHDYQEATCMEAEICNHCGASHGNALGHDASEATCTQDSVCRRCNAVLAKASGHDADEATCTDDSVCVNCGEILEKAYGHEFKAATCEEPEICSRCGMEQGSPLGHVATEATCTEASICTRCEKELAAALGHKTSQATCTKDGMCSRCGLVTEKATGHSFKEATCTAASTCTKCGTKQGKALGHSYKETDSGMLDGGKAYKTLQCERCQDQKTEYEQVTNPGNVDEYEEEVLRLTNEYRVAAGLSPLTMNYTLCDAGDVRAAEIVTSFSHTRPDGTRCFTAFNVAYRTAGENIAAGQTSPKEVVEAWMNSEGHRANILNPRFTQLAVGYLYSSSDVYGHHWVQLFIG